MPDDKVMPDVTAFLERLRVGEDGRGSVTLVVDDNAIADVTGSIELDISAHDAAHALVTAAHEYAKHHPTGVGTTHWDGCWKTHGECAKALLRRWWPVIEKARAFGNALKMFGDAKAESRLARIETHAQVQTSLIELAVALKEGEDA